MTMRIGPSIGKVQQQILDVQLRSRSPWKRYSQMRYSQSYPKARRMKLLGLDDSGQPSCRIPT